MEKIINLKIDINDNVMGGRLKIESDTQLYDEYETGNVTKNDFKFQSTTLTEVYKTLYNITQSNKVGSKNPIFKIDGEEFARMVDEVHLEINENLSMALIKKYETIENYDFQIKDKIKQTYGNDIEIKGIALRREECMAYRGYETDNYISDMNGNRDFKNIEEAKEALEYYLHKDPKRANINSIDTTVITLDGKPYKEMTFYKKPENKIKKANKKSKGFRLS